MERRPTAETMDLIAEACAEKPLTRKQIAQTLQRPHGQSVWGLAERMVAQGRLVRKMGLAPSGAIAYLYEVAEPE